MSKSKKTVTILCPVFNEEEAVGLFYQRLVAVLKKVGNKYRFELLFTNNASTDTTHQRLLEIRRLDPRVEIVTFSRNFGYQASLLAGLTYANGDATIIIDVDCEDPPEMVSDFLKKWEEGYDIVYGIRDKRPEARWITLMRKGFYRILKFVADNDIILDMAEFSLVSRRVRNEIINNNVNNTFPFIRADIAYSGFKKFGIRYNRQPRVVGKTHYNFYGMALFATAGIMSISTFPFRLAVYLLPFFVATNLVFVVFYRRIDIDYLVVADLLYIETFITMFGLYIARIYKNGIKRPVFIVDWENTTIKFR